MKHNFDSLLSDVLPLLFYHLFFHSASFQRRYTEEVRVTVAIFVARYAGDSCNGNYISLNTVVNLSTYRQLTTGYLKLSDVLYTVLINKSTRSKNKPKNKGIKTTKNNRAISNDCRKTKTKAITLTNHNRSRQCDEPITIPINYL